MRKAVMECPFCGKPRGKKAGFCDYCGWQFVNPVVRKAPSRKGLRAAVAGIAAVGALVALAIFGRINEAPQVLPISAISPAPAAGTAEIGETLDIPDGDPLPCYLAAEAAQDVARWILLGDKAEVTRTLRDAHWISLTSGVRVRIIGADSGRRKVRVLDTGQECWVDVAALMPGSN
jgi:hypothetical protein